MSLTPSRNQPFSQLIRRSQMALEEKPQLRRDERSSIPTSAEISQLALSRELDSLWGFEPRSARTHTPWLEKLLTRFALHWEKYLVVVLLYGLAVYGFFALTS